MYHKWRSYDAWFLRSWAWRTELFVILDLSLPFYPRNNPKNHNSKNNEIKKKQKKTWRYYHFTHVYQKWQSYDIWFLRYGAWWTEFFAILDHFLHIYCPNNSKNQNFEKMKKKIPGDTIILRKCTKNHDDMLCCSLDMVLSGCNSYLSFWAIFCPFTSLTARKITIKKKILEKYGDIIILQ